MNLKKRDYSDFQKDDFIRLITKLNTKIVYLQKDKSKQGHAGKTMGYKSNVCKDMILMYLKKDCKHPLDEIPSTKKVTVFDLRKRLCTFESNSS